MWRAPPVTERPVLLFVCYYRWNIGLFVRQATAVPMSCSVWHGENEAAAARQLERLAEDAASLCQATI